MKFSTITLACLSTAIQARTLPSSPQILDSSTSILAKRAEVRCQNELGDIWIDLTLAAANLAAAPTETGRSGYPHEFRNFQGFTWVDYRCHDRGPILELPIFADGHQYNTDSRPKDRPGEVRLIYTEYGKIFCGVIAHEQGSSGNFGMCT
ncbi:hypothetical protein DL765_004653 [Monosporascus sp. GIB2]|nr:hypothetical protein DL765_004653 [Monosporascus sp. GIB2]